MKWLDRTLIVSPYSFGLCLTEKDFHKALKKLNVPLHEYTPHTGFVDGATTHYYEQGGQKLAIVCLGNTKGYTIEQIHAILTHEAVHIWQVCMEEIGEHTPSYEFEAYSIQSITQSLLEDYKKQTTKLKQNAK
jgi:hypothetical protein